MFSDAVSAIRRAGETITGIETQRGSVFSTPILINAAGPASAAINALAGTDRTQVIGTRAIRQEVVHLKMPLSASGKPAVPCVVTDSDCGIYMRPELKDHIPVGSLEPSCDKLETVSPDAFDDNLSEQWETQAWRAALRFPSLGIPNTAQGYVALYDVSDDWIPVYDRSDIEGYFMAIGTSGNQFKTAPVVGEMMADLIVYVNAGRDHDSDPFQFELKYTSKSLDLRTFSRLRRLTEKSSFCVLG